MNASAPSPRPTAVMTAVILGGPYLLVFGRSIGRQIYGLLTSHSRPGTPDDYGAPGLLLQLPLWWGEVVLAVAIFYLVRIHYEVPAAEAGIPPKNSSPLPTLLTVVVAPVMIGLAGTVMNLLRSVSTPDQDAGIVSNAWALPGIISRSLNAGVTEELIVVALPVLLLSRRGWHPVAIAASSAVLRWPYHLWHGWPASLPWALIWGGGFALIFMVCRRLTALIVVHAAIDISIGIGQLYGAWIIGPALWAGAALVLVILLIAHHRANRQRGKRFGDLPRDARRFILSEGRRELVVLPAVLAAAVIGLALRFFTAFAAQSRAGTGALVGAIAGVLGLIAVTGIPVVTLGTANFEVDRAAEGKIDRIVRWRRTGAGELRLVETSGDDKVQPLLSKLAENGLPIVINAAPKSKLGRELAALGYPPVRGRWFGAPRSRIEPKDPS